MTCQAKNKICLSRFLCYNIGMKQKELGPNHEPGCTGKTFFYSGSGWDRVKVCFCGAEDHAPAMPKKLVDNSAS